MIERSVWEAETKAAIFRIAERAPRGIEMPGPITDDDWAILAEIEPRTAAVFILFARGMHRNYNALQRLSVAAFTPGGSA